MNLFDKAPMVITGEMCAKEAIGTNLLPPKAICAYTSSAMTGIPKFQQSAEFGGMLSNVQFEAWTCRSYEPARGPFGPGIHSR
jgi:hypothetical protein